MIVRIALFPEPLRATVLTLVLASWDTVRTPFLVPSAVGAKTTLIVQVALAGTEPPQSCVTL